MRVEFCFMCVMLHVTDQGFTWVSLDFFFKIKDEINVLAICQPTQPVHTSPGTNLTQIIKDCRMTDTN